MIQNHRNHQFLTDKQYKILTVICHGNGNDENGKLIPCDLNELLERVAYQTTKQSMQFSIRSLLARKLLTKDSDVRRGARRVTYVPTRLSMQIMGYHDPSYIEDVDLSHISL